MNHSEQILFVNFAGEPFFTDVIKKIQYDNKYVVIVASDNPGKHLPFEAESINLTLLQREETISDAFHRYPPVTLDGDILKAFYECKSYFMRTLDRVYAVPESIRSYESYFHELLAYTIGFFVKNKSLKAVIFEATPHFPWDIVVFFVARHLNIETRILRRTLLNDRVVFDCDFRKAFGQIIRYAPSESFLGHEETLSTDNASFWLGWSKSVNRRLKKSFFSSIPMQFLTSFPWLVVFFITSYPSFQTGYMKLSLFHFFWRLILQKIRVLTLKRWLLLNFDAVTLSEFFVYFALSFQPERSTDPEAEDFTHQYLAIEMLSESLPKGWKIYVKEHPRQISPHPDVRMTHYRSVQDYVRIQSISNVRLVHPDYESEELINRCKMTATCTGSTVWEGMLKGKPGITFGRVWHDGCRSSITVNNATDCLAAVNALINKFVPEVIEDVENFLSKFQTSMIISSNSEMSASASSIPRDILVSNLAEATIKSLP